MACILCPVDNAYGIMTELEFLKHHELSRNPFVDEDAQTDSVFQEFCISGTFHPSWSKVAGSPRQPATAIVFGPKGSGKTAMRLQLVRLISEHNRENPKERVFLVEYDDFNAYLGPFQEHLPRRAQSQPDRVLHALRLWDHMDAILIESVTQLVDRILKPQSEPTDPMAIDPKRVDQLDHGQRRDLLLLTSAFDHSKTSSHRDRFASLRSRLRFRAWGTWTPIAIGTIGTLVACGLCYFLNAREILTLSNLLWLMPVLIGAAWAIYGVRWLKYHFKAGRVCRNLRVLKRDRGQLRQILMEFNNKDIDEQPLPVSQRSDDRYALLEKFQLLLRSLGIPGMIIIVDRVDEPDLVNGMPDRMKQLIWPLLDNKLLKHEGLGLKLLLPAELQYFVERESREFHERARLDKQNVVSSFDWTGEALYDLLAARMQACTASTQRLSPLAFFDSSLSESRLLAALQSLHTPRNVFRFLYRLISEHCKRFRSESPQFKIATDLFESTLANYLSEERRN